MGAQSGYGGAQHEPRDLRPIVPYWRARRRFHVGQDRRPRMTEDEIYVNGHNNGIDEMLEIVQSWLELGSKDFCLDTSDNTPWVSLLSLAKLADELKL